ncbi:MAG: BON domain-containing protein [Pyrinomonadaceae bacterium]|jgi:hyperosmotically inducible protein|nr:BON domain-containing protein [Blastocatellia bacterium]MDQ3221097.1 BON domain-containing protein [Acidobacteriota bacterium]MDQ3489764.1 BON domain-containing protein [Acidobacteriota bacterium]
MKLRFLSILIGTAIAATAFSACDSTANNSTANVNMRNVNSNTAVVVNNNANMSNMNSNRWNSNITREEYEKDRATYDRDRGNSTVGSGANDSWLWVKTRAALLSTNDLRESTINVDVANDVVTLRGTVGTAAQKTRAGQVAQDIDGVKNVRNNLTVAPEDSMTNMSDNSSRNSNTNRR